MSEHQKAINCFLQPIQLSNTFVLTFDPLRITMLMGVWEGDDTCYFFFFQGYPTTTTG